MGCDRVSLFALSDLHLSLGSNKPMDVFGEIWKDHHIKIMNNWNSKIDENDTVLISGDISWALRFQDAVIDLDFVHKLNGKKVLIKGNHDYWWPAISKLNSLYDDMKFIQNTYTSYGEYAICGTRGWISMDNSEEHDEKIYNREVLRLKMSLDSAIKDGFKKFIVMMHYPPITRVNKALEFLEILNKYNVEKVVYGHVHYDSKAICINGIHGGREYICTSADIINFDPVRIL